MRFIRSLSFTLFVFGLLGWFYIAVNAWVHPETLPLAVTHLTPWLREDTLGIICFIVAFVSFFIWLFTKPMKPIRTKPMKLIWSLSFTLFVFGLLGWFYIAGNAWVHPETLPLAVTHLTPWLKEGTAGVICFIVSFVSLFVWLFTNPRNSV
jgi:small-conductance mechanosensitive channel